MTSCGKGLHNLLRRKWPQLNDLVSGLASMGEQDDTKISEGQRGAFSIALSLLAFVRISHTSMTSLIKCAFLMKSSHTTAKFRLLSRSLGSKVLESTICFHLSPLNKCVYPHQSLSDRHFSLGRHQAWALYRCCTFEVLCCEDVRLLGTITPWFEKIWTFFYSTLHISRPFGWVTKIIFGVLNPLSVP